MPRRRRLILSGFPHHVTHRGNRRAEVFRDDFDRRFYLSKLEKYANQYQVQLYSYSLMPNHVHHICVPSTPESLSGCMHDLHGVYTDYFNRRHRVSGHLWQERFYACVLDESHLWTAIRYVERNAVRARLVDRAEDFQWSSAPAHCGLRDDPILEPRFPPAGLIPDWGAWLAIELSVSELEKIRQATWRGVPCATKPFIQELEKLSGLRLLPRKRGRRRRRR